MSRWCKLCDRTIEECIFITDISISQQDSHNWARLFIVEI